MCLILLIPVAVYFSLICKMFIAVYFEWRKPSLQSVHWHPP